MDALKMAKQLIHDGRISDQNDFHEMKIEMEHEMNERGISQPEQKKALAEVQKKWY